MKRISLLLICTIFSFIAIANPIAPEYSTALFDHLHEVNKEWEHFYTPQDFKDIYHFENDNQRIQMHLMLVENHLRKTASKDLSLQQIQKRNQALDILKTYYENARFPENHYHTVRQPYFIDNYNTACAVGHLMIETGYEAIAHRISKENNYAYIKDLTLDYPELGQWAEAFGFSINELAWIQPGYPPQNQSWNKVGNGGITEGNIKVMKAFEDEMLYMAGDFTMVDDVSANGIIAWDGNDWHTLGAGVNGTINDIAIDQAGRVFIGGEFSLNENANMVNLAYWSDGEWNGFNTSNMTGAVISLHIMSDILYIGGAFEISYSNTTIENLAYVQIGGSNLENQNGDFSVDGIVYDLSSKGNELLVAGSFLSTASQSNNSSIHKLQTKYLATWGEDASIGSSNWLQAFDQELEPSIYAALATDSKLYIGANNNNTPESFGLGIFQDSNWAYDYCGGIDPDNDQVIRGFLRHNGVVLAYGNIQYIGQFVFIQSYGISVLENSDNSSDGAQFDAPVLAAESFQNQIFFAGEFTTVQGQSFPGLVSSPFDGIVTSVSETALENKLNVFSTSNQIQIQYDNLDENFEFGIYDLNGHLLAQKELPLGSAETSILTQDWANGIYVFRAISKSGKRYGGKISVLR